MYKIKDRMTTPILLIETEPVKNNGRVIYNETENTEQTWCVWKGYGGSEKVVEKSVGSGQTTLTDYEDTANVQMRYTPFINQNSHIKNLITGKTYRIISVPDDINQLHQYLVFKVKLIG